MIHITGDTHSDFSRLSSGSFPQQRVMCRNDYVIITGDFGGVCQKGQHFIQHKPSSSEGYFSASLEKALFFGPFSTFSFSWFWKQGSHICGNISILAMAAALSAYADTL